MFGCIKKQTKINSVSYKDTDFIECNNCKKYYTFNTKTSIVLCSSCDQYYCCGILGECVGPRCRYEINHNIIIARYCRNCASPIDDTTCICNTCKSYK